MYTLSPYTTYTIGAKYMPLFFSLALFPMPEILNSQGPKSCFYFFSSKSAAIIILKMNLAAPIGFHIFHHYDHHFLDSLISPLL